MKLLPALALVLASASAQATVITYNFSGVFGAPVRASFGGATSPEPVFLDLVKAGEQFSGSFSFDTDAVATSYAGDPFRWATYATQEFKLQGSAALSAAVPSWGVGSIQVTDDNDPWMSGNPVDELIATAGAAPDGQHNLSFVLRMNPGSSNAFHDFRVPAGFNGFTDATLSFYLFHSEVFVYDIVNAQVKVSLDGAPAEVPEPATGLLLLAGLGGLAALRRRR
ncbi:VPLPA-CTERM sorting domain-containing protein [Massilia sp. ST3]|uniref:VPLPA-CTERM sorting domain-containing protein n=1 Tax=Massilia sp. ST3 TaxID=2824903 RepID=UPI001B81546D|nr:VPLPA-CTERM sorting domain-containing protein [Massilia sp. ST3]MBQ5947151.1 VPLPA-CTERM sorting domain-containing protein [Massilia sp. ST3]